jgi:hypothetical protein
MRSLSLTILPADRLGSIAIGGISLLILAHGISSETANEDKSVPLALHARHLEVGFALRKILDNRI